jgi:bifunctional DNA-binding transcriptional regulator/antitoxin component of YhaV-PrlF toxin-antitoxin module
MQLCYNLYIGDSVLDEEKKEPVEESKPGKVDISRLLAIVPSAAELRVEKKVLQEKRIRIRFDRSLVKPVAIVPTSIARELDIKTGDAVEIVVAGKKKAVFTAQVEDRGENVVIVYPAELEKQGVADNSIATIRKVKA